MLITIIIFLLQEDNICASLTYSPQLQYLCYEKINLFTVCTEQMRSPYTEHTPSMLRAGYSNLRTWKGGSIGPGSRSAGYHT